MVDARKPVLAVYPRPDFRLSNSEREALAAELKAGVPGYEIPDSIVQLKKLVGQ